MYPTNFRSGLLNQGQALGTLNLQVSLTADNQYIDMQLLGKVEITSDNTTATNRTFTLANGYVDGQSLVLILVSGSSTACDLQDTGNVALSAAWQPAAQDGSLTLMWSQFRGKWIELARSVN